MVGRVTLSLFLYSEWLDMELETQLRLQCLQAFLHGTKGYIYLDNQVQLSTLTYTLLNLGARVQAWLLHIPPSSTILQAVSRSPHSSTAFGSVISCTRSAIGYKQFRSEAAGHRLIATNDVSCLG